MTLLTMFESFVLVGWSCIVFYGFVISLVSWITKRRSAPLIYPRHIFALIIPVDNDEGIIGTTVEHLRRLKYPRNMFEVVVVPVNSTDQTITIARQKKAIVYGPGNNKWHNRDEAILATLERLSSKDRYNGFLVLNAMARLSPNYLNVLSDELSKGALIVQSGYQTSGPNWSLNTGIRANLAALSPSWLTGWSARFRLGGGLRHIGFCLSRRVIEKYQIRNPAITDLNRYMLNLLKEDVVITFAEKATLYDGQPTVPAAPSMIDRWRTTRDFMHQHATNMIQEGIKWRSIAQVLGGINVFLPSFTGMFTVALFFYIVAAALHGFSSTITMGWLMLNISLFIVVLLRLGYSRAPIIAYAVMPSLPFVLWWRAINACFNSPPDVVPQGEPIKKAVIHNKKRSRQRKSPQRQPTRRQPS